MSSLTSSSQQPGAAQRLPEGVIAPNTPLQQSPASPAGLATPLTPYPDSGLGEVGPHGDLLPHAHVRVAVPLESGFQLLQLLAGEVGPLPPLLLLLRRVVGGPVLVLLLAAALLLCGGVVGIGFFVLLGGFVVVVVLLLLLFSNRNTRTPSPSPARGTRGDIHEGPAPIKLPQPNPAFPRRRSTEPCAGTQGGSETRGSKPVRRERAIVGKRVLGSIGLSIFPRHLFHSLRPKARSLLHCLCCARPRQETSAGV